jgi:hypothetical protein
MKIQTARRNILSASLCLLALLGVSSAGYTSLGGIGKISDISTVTLDSHLSVMYLSTTTIVTPENLQVTLDLSNIDITSWTAATKQGVWISFGWLNGNTKQVAGLNEVYCYLTYTSTNTSVDKFTCNTGTVNSTLGFSANAVNTATVSQEASSNSYIGNSASWAVTWSRDYTTNATVDYVLKDGANVGVFWQYGYLKNGV